MHRSRHSQALASPMKPENNACTSRGEEQCSPSFHFLCILAPADRGNHACAATCWWSGRPQAGEPQVAATKRSSDTQVPIPSFPKYRNRTAGPSTEIAFAEHMVETI